MTLAAATVLLGIGAPAQAQFKARLEITPSATGDDTHPATYSWDGEVRPVRDPVQYYTFYYVGVVSADATVPVGSRIGRVPVPNIEWEAEKGNMVNQLTSFYEAAFGLVSTAPGGSANNNVAFDQNFNFVAANPPPQQANAGAADPRAAAEWTFYYDQFVLWQFYVKRTLLNVRDAERASSSEQALARQAFRASVTSGDSAISLEEADRLLEEAQAAAAAAGAGAPALDDSVTVATEFNPAADYTDPSHNDRYLGEFLLMGEARERLATRLFRNMLLRIDGRTVESLHYQNWLDDKRDELYDFASAWERVQTGERVTMEDTFYLITKEPMLTVPRDARNVVMRDVLTPQDLISPDGNLKGPQFDD